MAWRLHIRTPGDFKDRKVAGFIYNLRAGVNDEYRRHESETLLMDMALGVPNGYSSACFWSEAPAGFDVNR